MVLHAGQLRYHDFTLLRQAREERAAGRSGGALRPSSSSSGPLRSLLRQPLSPLSVRPPGGQARTFLTGLRRDLHLKSLERLANASPADVSAQRDFLSELGARYPEAVVRRFEDYPEFAADESCGLVYLDALQRTGQAGRFGLRGFADRLRRGGASPRAVEALAGLRGGTSEDGGGARPGRPELAARAGRVLAGESGGGAASPPGSHRSPVGGILGGSARGASPSSPLFVQTHSPVRTGHMLLSLARQVLVAFVVVSALTVVLAEQGLGRGGMGAMGSGKHIQEAEGTDVRFDDVKGVKEAKAELEEIVLYLRDPDRFTRLGGKLPRGLLLTGPPGTGKTLLAKAIAGEAGVPFFFSSGSQFEEVYVGLGAKRVRELFEAAKQKSPSIIFIDEIDALGGSRKLKDQAAMKMTLNELLVQMDGFDENNGIIVIGATNFAESLDSALLRPGRFDKHVSVPLPDVGGRKEILEMYSTKTKIAPDVDLGILARGTTGFSGADLYNLMNQAAVKASVDGLDAITMSVFEWAKDKILMGAERKSAVITPETARCTAYHEAGHALVGVLTEGAQRIHKATIMPRGQALGMVMTLPEGDQTSMSHRQMIASMDVCMGGRIAEELIFGEDNVTSGASSDIQQATRIARAMVTKYGFNDDVGIVFYGGDTGQEDASGKTRAQIDEAVKKLTSDAYERARVLLTKHEKKHRLLAETLLEYETLTGDEVREIVLRGKKPARPVVNTDGGSRGDQSVLRSSPAGKGEESSGKKGRLAELVNKVRPRSGAGEERQ